MNTPSVTIAIPFYNGESFLREAIQSVLNQTYNDFELLLIDDGSTDSALAIARSFETDRRVKVISDGENRGLVYRLNQSVELARGSIYARMDADDIMHPERICKQVEFLTSHPEIDVVGTSIYSIDDKDVIRGCHPAKTDIKPGELPGLVHPTVAGKTTWFKANKYDPEFVRGEDAELWLRTRKTSRFANINIPLLFYREFGVPTTKKYLKTKATAIKRGLRARHYGLPLSYTIKVIMSSIAKSMLCVVCGCMGKTDLIIKYRSRASIPFNREEAVKALNSAISPVK